MSTETTMCQRLEDTRVYVEALAISDEVWDQVATWKWFERDTIGGKQLVRAADSVSANIGVLRSSQHG